MEKPKRSLAAALLYSLYPLIALPFYVIEGESLSGHPVFAAIYYQLLLVHGVLLLLAVCFEWIGFGSKKRSFRKLASVFMAISILPMLISAVIILPLMIAHRLLLSPSRSL